MFCFILTWRSSSARQSKRLIIAVSPVQVRPPLPRVGSMPAFCTNLRKVPAMAKSSDVRPKITLACGECKERNYITKKNRRNDPDRLEVKKYCARCNKHTAHKETR